MELSYPQYVDDYAGYPFLRVLIDGEPADIFYEQKFLDMDLVHVLGWEGKTEPITLPANPKIGAGEITLRGFVRDKRLAELVRRYCDATDNGTFRVGPVELPPEVEE